MNPRTAALACLTGLLLAACGGGGDSATAVPQDTPVRSTALAAHVPPAGFGFATARSARALNSRQVVADPSRFADPARTYVSLWLPAAGGERRQVALLTLAALQALDARGGLALSLPADARGLSFEVYDTAGAARSLSGEVVL